MKILVLSIPDRQMKTRTGTGFPGDVADFHLTLGNFGSLQLKQAADQVGMGTGNMDQRTTVCPVNLQNVNTDQIAGLVLFAGDLLGNTQNCIILLVALTDANKNIAGRIDAQDGAGQQLLSLGGVALVDNTTLSLPNALDDHLLGGLGGDAAELLDIHGDCHGVAGLQVGVVASCGVDVMPYRHR